MADTEQGSRNGTAPDAASAAPARLPAGVLGQLSRSDSPRFTDGASYPDDYVPRLTNPLERMKLFEEMRMDEAINTPLTAREQLIKSANWLLASPDDTPRAREILEFVEDNVYPLLDIMLEQLGGGALQYGVGLFEPVFARADAPAFTSIARGKIRRAAKSKGRRIYLTRIARIRQRSIWTFRIAETGELTAIEQHVSAGGTFRRITIPPHKVVHWTFNQQGDDHWGRPPLRHLYRAWDFKRQIENLAVLGFDRFGVGTPVVTGGQDWTDAEYAKVFEFLKRLRSGGTTGLVAPFGGTADYIGGQGALASGFLDFVKWYTLACAKTYLTQQSELGSTETGARAVGETMYDQMEGATQADCEAIAQILNERVIVPLVQWNFGPQESYPAFNPSQRVRQSTAIATTIASLKATGAVGWDAKDEAWMRDQLGLPDIDITARQAEMDEAKEAAKATANAALAAAGAQDGAKRDDERDNERNDRSKLRAQGRAHGRGVGSRGEGRGVRARALTSSLSQSFALAAPAPAVAGESHRTAAWSAWEARVMKPAVLARDLDVEAARTAAEVHAVLVRIDESLYLQVEAMAKLGAESLSDVVQIRVADPLRAQLREVLYVAALRARARGQRSVEEEVGRQRAPDVAAPTRMTRMARLGSVARRAVGLLVALADGRPTGEDAAELERRLALRALCDAAAEEELARREAAARGAALAALQAAEAAEPEELAQVASARAKGALEELSVARTEDNVAGVVNAGFGTGRTDGADQILEEDPDALVAMVYSAILDDGTCEECAKWDGAWFPIDYDTSALGAVQAPNPKCAGTLKRCRCQFVFVLRDEAPSIIGPEKGPMATPAMGDAA